MAAKGDGGGSKRSRRIGERRQPAQEPRGEPLLSRERIVATAVRTPADYAAENPNYVGGDIAGGANDPLQLVGRPTLLGDPYATGVPGVYLCSSATPPGAGVHGMSGYHAATRALRWLSSQQSPGSRQPRG